MLALTLTCALLVQQPMAPTWVTSGVDRERPAASVIQGTVELDSAKAYEAARDEAVSRVRGRWQARGEELVEETAPAWLPAFVTERAVRDWLAHLKPERSLEILDRSDLERQHDFYPSYQTSLLVVEDPDLFRRAERRLGQALARAERTFLARAGGTLGLWAFLALGVFWLDRLSRGYMTGRLSLLAVAIGAGVPVVLFLI